MKTILIIDDEPVMLDLLSLYLSPLGFRCVKVDSGLKGIKYLEENNVDLILLDIMMPEMDGWETCKEIRNHWDTPIIMLTARDSKEDIVKGLKGGADDYISKPFDEEELVARIEAVLRRQKNNHGVIQFNGLSLDQDAFQLQFKGININLTPKEFGLITLFLTNQNIVFTREHLITSIWGYEVSTEDRTIDSHIRNLREKLRKAGFPAEKYLQTVWGVGYKWNSHE
ncbi:MULTISPECIES: response regulator transcription factor [Bacillaceae]|jgi:DNA-binding response OmpR family regulator|uniref:response regulator transcription factor n=1 Tax=Bacillaceae TaxID=186817 RepID=UPI000D559967|nr:MULTISPECIES: response regulator transcription factor [Bacillaceae]AWI12592.1 DNA-binding response regulator [Caldibacillus thermoamylovorans]MCU9599891.1 response regulator transcription factor [Pallidibacillus thermolactis subsp. kokeshiiformis]